MKQQILYKTKEELQIMNEKSLEFNKGIQYSIEELILIVKYSSTRLRSILRTQRLTYDFCKVYLLSDEYCVLDCDDISIFDIAKYQPHLIEHFSDLENKIINDEMIR